MLYLFHFSLCDKFRLMHVYSLLGRRRGLALDIFFVCFYDLSGVRWLRRAGIAGDWPETCLALNVNGIIEVALKPLAGWLKWVTKVLFVEGRFFWLDGWHNLMVEEAELVSDVINLFGWAGVFDCSLEHCSLVLFVFCEHLTSVSITSRLFWRRLVHLRERTDSIVLIWLVDYHKLAVRCCRGFCWIFALVCQQEFGGGL